MKTQHIPKFTLPPTSHDTFSLSVERLNAHAGYNSQAPHRHAYYEIFFFERGGGLHMIDFKEIYFEKGHIHMLYPGQVHYMRREAGARGWVLKFSASLLHSYAACTSNAFQIPLLQFARTEGLIQSNEAEFHGMVNILKQIQQEENTKKMGYRHVMGAYLNLILWKCYRQAETDLSQGDRGAKSLNRRFQTLLEENYASHNRVTFYAEQLAVSPDKLNTAVKRATGSCPSRLIAERILLEAKRWLLHSQKSIKEIAYELNFQDHAYFNRWFKKQVACSPGEFRRGIKEKYHA